MSGRAGAAWLMRGRPERQEDIKFRTNFLTFGVGPHMCVGREYAINHLISFLSVLSTQTRFGRRAPHGILAESARVAAGRAARPASLARSRTCPQSTLRTAWCLSRPASSSCASLHLLVLLPHLAAGAISLLKMKATDTQAILLMHALVVALCLGADYAIIQRPYLESGFANRCRDCRRLRFARGAARR